MEWGRGRGGLLLVILSPVSLPLDLIFCRREVSLSSGFSSGRSRGISYSSENDLDVSRAQHRVLASKPLVVTQSSRDTPAGAGTQPVDGTSNSKRATERSVTFI